VRVDDAGGERVGGELAPLGEEEVCERRPDGSEDHDEKPRQEPADARQLEQRRREEHDLGLREDVAGSDVRELVRQDRVQLPRSERRHETGADRQRGAARVASDDERTWKAVVEQLEARRRDPDIPRQPVDRRAEQRILGEGVLACAEHPEERAIPDGVRAGGREE